ncbi:uncharacterized protein PAC_19301 [Phialocephala subalpina]|uniref:Heterokaryon incompatibility domain-containing protein n=1 Tax=Phialocephala subalpina TaxID=576137 RepID=A0A1L7XWH3_9HELO|nr:uncharacterized protein PAC_19301 [Phialocephala subalpina]
MLQVRRARIVAELPSIYRSLYLPSPTRHTNLRFQRNALSQVQFRTFRTFRRLNTSQQDAARYQYNPLPSSPTPSIRLLELLPSRDPHPVSFILKEEPLSDHLQYEAVSYCWGDPKDISSISCNGKQLFVPRRLESALRSMRYPDRPRVLWADAICINQSDVLEKEEQVQLMRTIFSQAQRTLIFLGDVDEKSQQKMSKFALLSLKICLAIFRRKVNLVNSPRVLMWDARENRSRTMIPFAADFYLELMSMLRMPWFKRAWVVQEVAVSSTATIFWGSSQYNWEDVILALKFMSRANFPLAFIVTLEDISAIEEERISYWKGHNRLLGVLLRHQRCLATDPRDKIFSFCGLIETSSEPKVPVDISYENDVAAVFRETARNIVKQDRTLDILSRPPIAAVSTLNLPSWVPDWSISPNSTLTHTWGHGPRSLADAESTSSTQNRHFSATSGSKYSPNIQEDALAVEGYKFDRIIKIGPVFEGARIPHTTQSALGIVLEWVRCIEPFSECAKSSSTGNAWSTSAPKISTPQVNLSAKLSSKPSLRPRSTSGRESESN